jgi:hypothetical protein
MMVRFFGLLVLCAIATLTGCSRSSSNVIDGADQAAIDAYEAQVKENDKALSEYKEID